MFIIVAIQTLDSHPHVMAHMGHGQNSQIGYDHPIHNKDPFNDCQKPF